ncbi:unnamed protein product [Coffea canephora]|uniref:non-specific serine/threonine protein kinase n=1 Tax=Coffea canephora TaxID=49390 RepID=A0A068U7U6_COFCA|nr:unnamed protein product [Coffea canephora]
MENLSVAYHLSGNLGGFPILDGKTNLKRISFDTAHGLEYLHEHCYGKIVHPDLKPGNIHLDDNLEAFFGGYKIIRLQLKSRELWDTLPLNNCMFLLWSYRCINEMGKYLD